MKTDGINSLSIEEKRISEEILQWSNGNESILNVISPPYNTTLVFFETILNFVRHQRKVLYITDEKRENILLIRSLRTYTSFRKYTYLKNSVDIANYLLVFCNFNKAIKMQEKFDLIIYDENRSYPKYSKEQIEGLVNKYKKENTKFVSYSVEEVFDGGREVWLSIRNNRNPIVEPRLIITRIDVNKEMPYVIYEYITWSMNINRRVIIPVPDKVKLFNVMSYVCESCKTLTRNIFYYSVEEKNIKAISKFRRYNDSIIVTDDFDSVCLDDENSNIIVFFADDEKFTYKDLTYFCGKTGKGGVKNRGEVILLANVETLDIEKAKSITRNFNKEAWEKGLLRL